MSNSTTTTSYLTYGNKITFKYSTLIDYTQGLIVSLNNLIVTNYIIDNSINSIIFDTAPTGNLKIIGLNYTGSEDNNVIVSNNIKLGSDDSDLLLDAWGRQKVIHDYSMFSGLFTYDVPFKVWKQMDYDGSTNYIEQTSITAGISNQGALEFRAGLNGNKQLRSHEHFRYQSNRGHLYSTSIFLPNPNANLIRRFGLILPCNGVFIELDGSGTDFKLYFVIRNHFIETRYEFTDNMPFGYDLSKGNLFDIQFQWRGVGGYKVYFQQKLVFNTNDLGKRDKLSVENPSLPAGFEIISVDDEPIICGCVDITSEGGTSLNTKYQSFNTGTTLIKVNSEESALLAIRMPYKMNYNGDEVCYSRDAILEQITGFTKDESFTSLYIGRGVNLPNLKGLTWGTHTETLVESLVGGENSDLDDAFKLDQSNMTLVKAVRQERDFSNILLRISDNLSRIVITADTYLVVAIKPDASNKSGCDIELSEQI